MLGKVAQIYTIETETNEVEVCTIKNKGKFSQYAPTLFGK